MPPADPLPASQTPLLSRRDALKAAAAAGLATSLPAAAQTGKLRIAVNWPDPKRVLRLAHVTDIHLHGRNGSNQALARAYGLINKIEDLDLVVNTGDSVMCVNNVDRTEADRQWDLFTTITNRELEKPVIHAIGNHDLWSWQPPTDEAPMRGKGMPVDRLELPDRYYTHPTGRGWTFVVLDSIFGGYTGRLDEAQMTWLAAELDRIPDSEYICVCTHIPIISACGFFDGNRFGQHGWTMPGSWMHEDAAALVELFAGHPNVRLCLSGHMHQVDRIDFRGVAYLCSGAVSASWWGGKYYQCDYGFSVVDLLDDGSFRYRYLPYGWTTPEPAGD